MILPQNENDDEHFIALVDSFVRAYAAENSATHVALIHIDNWFGERWLGFAGKFRGVASIRQRKGKLGINGALSLAIPPFRPTRVQSYAGFTFNEDGTRPPSAFGPIHREKNGGWTQRLWANGLYVWYSGKTATNTNGSLMVYELNGDGQNAWYLQFQMDSNAKWDVVSCRNTQMARCRAISAEHYCQSASQQSSPDSAADECEPRLSFGYAPSKPLTLFPTRFSMRYFLYLLVAIGGMTMGLALSLLLNGFPPTGETFIWGLGGALLAVLIQSLIYLSDDEQSRQFCKQPKRIKRTESEGSFTERMARYAQNVDDSAATQDETTKQEFWMDPSCDEYEVTPPKPVSIIRMLLYRIRRILSGR